MLWGAIIFGICLNTAIVMFWTAPKRFETDLAAPSQVGGGQAASETFAIPDHLTADLSSPFHEGEITDAA